MVLKSRHTSRKIFENLDIHQRKVFQRDIPQIPLKYRKMEFPRFNNQSTMDLDEKD